MESTFDAHSSGKNHFRKIFGGKEVIKKGKSKCGYENVCNKMLSKNLKE
jgi:hypothetical protein